MTHDGSFASGRFCSMRCSRSFVTADKRAEINARVSKKLSEKFRPEGYWCDRCQVHFKTAREYNQHRRPAHKRSFESLKKDGTRREWLVKERGRRCEVCQNEVWNGRPIPIELDHISGDADDNRKENLRLICPNCHAQTSTYKGGNVASESRKKRYRKYYAPVSPLPSKQVKG